MASSLVHVVWSISSAQPLVVLMIRYNSWILIYLLTCSHEYRVLTPYIYIMVTTRVVSLGHT